MEQTVLTQMVEAIAALGTTSYALVDASKVARSGGASNFGFDEIEAAVFRLYCPAPDDGDFNAVRDALRTRGQALLDSKGALALRELLGTLHGNWINGVALVDQKAIAKSLLKLQLSAVTAPSFAAGTGVSPQVLASVAAKMNAGQRLEDAEVNVLGRFDVALTALLDEGYQRADQMYRNACKLVAGAVAVALALCFGALYGAPLWQALICGLVAVPLAPLAKDITSALTAGVKLAQGIKR